MRLGLDGFNWVRVDLIEVGFQAGENEAACAGLTGAAGSRREAHSRVGSSGPPPLTTPLTPFSAFPPFPFPPFLFSFFLVPLFTRGSKARQRQGRVPVSWW